MKPQVILITGASSGMGRNSAIDLAREGHTVYGAARRLEKLKELESHGVRPIGMDITKEDQVRSAVEQVIAEEGRIDVLVNNAGFGMYGAVEDTSIDDARYQFEVNLFGLARLTQLVLPHMREQRHGKIINISSVGGRIYTPLGAWYHATKHALEGWSDSLRLETKEFGVDVVVVQPGLIETEFGDVLLDPMIERSGSGAYAELAHEIKRATEENYAGNNGSPSSVISRTIRRIVETNKPRTRYAVGKLAKPLLFMRKFLGDRMFDRVIMSQVN